MMTRNSEKDNLFLVRIHVFEQILWLWGIPAKTLQNGLQVLCVDLAASFRIKHIEDAFEIVNFFSWVNLKNFVILVVLIVVVLVALLSVITTQLLLYLFLVALFIVLVDTVVFFIFLPLSVIVTLLEFLLIHLN